MQITLASYMKWQDQQDNGGDNNWVDQSINNEKGAIVDATDQIFRDKYLARVAALAGRRHHHTAQNFLRESTYRTRQCCSSIVPYGRELAQSSSKVQQRLLSIVTLEVPLQVISLE
jgi:hypothetical protein